MTRVSLTMPALISAFAIAAGCTTNDASRALDAMTAEALEAHTRFLASDLLQGRRAGSAGSELAALYIETQFRQMGLQPGVGDSSFLQPVPLVSVESQASLAFRASGGASFRPAYGEAFVAWSADTAATRQVEGELVFVGYGIQAPEYGWDDYKDTDVAGKIVLMLAASPGQQAPGAFRGDSLTYYSFPEYKLEEAARRGAAGAILIHSPDLVLGWDAVLSAWAGTQIWLDPASRGAAPGLEGWLSQDAARQVISMAGLDFATLLESARSENFRPIATGVSVSSTLRNRARRFVDFNVVGLLPGSDPELAGEYVVVVAHYDHLGIGPAVESDSIYNGCYDNASGTALLLGIADSFARLTRYPARSILFIAVTAGEPGLLGSQYYVENPLVPLRRTVAAINIDGANVWGLTTDVAVVGAEGLSLAAIVAEAAAAENLELKSDHSPERGFLYRSDQFSFMRRGVPVYYVQHGLDYVGRMPGWGKQVLEEYGERRYHRPSDECRPEFDYRGAVQQGRVAFRLVLGAAGY